MSDRRCAIITGASRGIGAATAVELAARGFDVAVVYKSNAQMAERVADMCRERGAESVAVAADVSLSGACEALVKEVVSRFGRIDVLVNNAGITRDGLLARMSESAFDEVIAANLKSAFNMMRYVSPIMMKARSGRIINISSVSGISGNAGQVNYSASKAGIIGMTKSAARELGPRGITVNAVAPGFIQTDMTADLPEGVKSAALEAIALKRFGKPEDVAAVVGFLASDAASYITGQVIVVDGGMIF